MNEKSDAQVIIDLLDKARIPYAVPSGKGCIVLQQGITIGFDLQGRLMDIIVV